MDVGEEVKTFFNLGDDIYKIRCPIQASGPPGILLQRTISPTEVRVMLFIPGVPRASLHVDLDSTKRWILFKGKEHYMPNFATRKYYSELTGRTYEGAIGFNGSRCCFVISDFDAKLDDGVLTLFIEKNFVTKKPCPSCSPRKPHIIALAKKRIKDNDEGMFLDMHPMVTEGACSFQHTQELAEGGVVGRADVAGVKDDEMEVWMEEEGLRFYGRVGGKVGECTWWEYSGRIKNPLEGAGSEGKAMWNVENGVFRFRIFSSEAKVDESKASRAEMRESLMKVIEKATRLDGSEKQSAEFLEEGESVVEQIEAELMKHSNYSVEELMKDAAMAGGLLGGSGGEDTLEERLKDFFLLPEDGDPQVGDG